MTQNKRPHTLLTLSKTEPVLINNKDNTLQTLINTEPTLNNTEPTLINTEPTLNNTEPIHF